MEPMEMEDVLPIEPITNYETLEKADLIRLLNEKEKTYAYYLDINDKLKGEAERISKVYNHDMQYMSDLTDNMLNRNIKKEDAIVSILDGVMALTLLDRESIRPKEGEMNNGN